MLIFLKNFILNRINGFDYVLNSFLDMRVAIETVVEIDDDPVLKIELGIGEVFVNLFDGSPV